MLNDFQVSKHFNLREFQCGGKEKPCSLCRGAVKVDTQVLGLLEELRRAVQGPIVLSSGYRCQARNSLEGGSPTSLHMEGLAVDVKCGPLGISEAQLAEIAWAVGWPQVGAYAGSAGGTVRGKRGFCHLGITPTRIAFGDWEPGPAFRAA